MRAFATAVLTMLATLPATAALPPQYQRQAELLAIVNDMTVVEAFGFDGVEAIEYVDQDLYRVRGGACVLDVKIEDLPNEHEAGWAGPREFKLVVGKVEC